MLAWPPPRVLQSAKLSPEREAKTTTASTVIGQRTQTPGKNNERMHFGKRKLSAQGCKVSQGRMRSQGLGGRGGGSRAVVTELLPDRSATRGASARGRHVSRATRQLVM